MSSKPIRSYSLAAVVNAANYSTVKIRHQTQNRFYVEFENSFLVLPDAKTVIGVDALDKIKLMIEDITRGNPRKIETFYGLISTVLFDSLTQSLLVGDEYGNVKQYKKVNGLFTMVKDYKDVGVGFVFSSTQVGQIAIFGGYNYSLVAIDILEKRVLPGLLNNSFKSTFSLQVCEGVGSDFYLSLGGSKPNYSSNASDFLDVTLLYNRHKEINELYEKKNHARALLEEKDEIINSLNLKIKQLESSLQKQVKQNEGKNNARNPKSKQVPKAETRQSYNSFKKSQEQNPESSVPKNQNRRHKEKSSYPPNDDKKQTKKEQEAKDLHLQR